MNHLGTGSIIEAASGARKERLRPSEWFLLAALAALFVVSMTIARSVPTSSKVAFVTVGTLLVASALALGESGKGWRYWMRELLPVPVVPFIYLNLGTLIPAVNATVRDADLLRMDRLLLGQDVQAALYALPMPAFMADVLTLAYSTFFFLPIVLVIVLARRRDPALPQVTAALVMTFLLSYVGYFLVPAYGPRAGVALERYATLPHGFVGALLRDLLDNWEKTKTDAFPSGHTMVTLAVLFCSRRRDRRLYNVLLPVGTMLIAATILLTYHYVVDVLAAIPLTVTAVLIAHAAAGPVPPAPTRSARLLSLS